MISANPTIETQKRIIEVIENSSKPISLTAISKLSKKGYNEVKASVNFFAGLGILDLIISSGNSTFVILKKQNCEVTNK
jgi:hypothetical protein